MRPTQHPLAGQERSRRSESTAPASMNRPEGARRLRRFNFPCLSSFPCGSGVNAALPFAGLTLIALLAGGITARAAAPVDTAALPPADSRTIEFTRDIKPILDRSCLRCHGPEKPKSGFRLDQREFALKGGSQGVDIVVSNSAASPLIHYAARLKGVEEMWMPPEDKGAALSPEEVALLRAWIDQGAAWGTAQPQGGVAVSAAPTVGWVGVSGNQGMFREHQWQPDGWNGGLETLHLNGRTDDRTQVQVDGHVLRDDYKLTLEVSRRDLGFVRAGFEQYRKYYADTGGYYPYLTPPMESLGEDLHLDLGKAWVDFGLTLPDWPRMTLGYEHQYRDGAKSLTSWGVAGSGAQLRNIAPVAKQIDEEIHILKFDLDHELAGWRVENQFRAEFGSLKTARTSTVQEPPVSGTIMSDHVRESMDTFQAANALKVEREFLPWLFGSAGYLFNTLSSDGAFTLDETYLSGPTGYPRQWQSPSITLEQQANVGNANAQFVPCSWFTATLGLQGEVNRQKGFGNAYFGTEIPDLGLLVSPATQHTDIDRSTLAEHAGMRFTAIPYTVIFADARLQQESLGHFEEQLGGPTPMRRDTDATTDLRDWRVGFNASPWPRVSLGGHYRRLDRDTAFDHQTDMVPLGTAFYPGDGYSAFITSQEVHLNELEGRLVVRPAAWVKTSLTYRLESADYNSATDAAPGGFVPGGWLRSGTSDASVYSVNVALAPFRKLRLSGAFSLRDTDMWTQTHDTPALKPYRGDTYIVTANGTYYWNDKTDLLMTYAFSWADYTQDNVGAGLPLGVHYQQHGLMAGLRRQFSRNVSGTLRYGFYLYDEPSSGHLNDYTAHLVFATLNLRWE
jgi:hypothetical protein